MLLVGILIGPAIVLPATPALAEVLPTALPKNAGDVNDKFQPAMDYDTDGCYPTPAVGMAGDLNAGLKTTGAANGSCRDASDLVNTNMYARSRCNANGWCAHMYGLYFQKDQSSPGAGHRHDLEHMVVWVKDDKVEYVSVSQHSGYETVAAEYVNFDDRGGTTAATHPKVVYHKDGPSTHCFRFAEEDEDPENHQDTWQYPDLVSWNGYPTSPLDIRRILTEADFGSASLAIKDSSFATNLERAYRTFVVDPVEPSAGYVELPFEFDFNVDSRPAGMPDPNTPGNGSGGGGGGGGGDPDPTNPPGTPGGQQIAVASYIHPSDTGAWTRLIEQSPTNKVSVLIANVLNGPDSQPDPSWAGVISRAAGSGKKILGYVRTGYLGQSDQHFRTRLGSTDLADWTAQIQRDVDKWYELYPGVGGIFFDEGHNICGAGDQLVKIYRELNQYAKHKHPGALTVVNPGTAVPQCYEDAADILMTFESSYTTYTTAYQPMALGWKPKDPSKIWHIVYGTPQDKIGEVAALARERDAGYIEITDDVLDNPYDTLPSAGYWTAEMAAVGGGAPKVAPAVDGPAGVPAPPSGMFVLDPSYGVAYTSIKLSWASSPSGAARYRVYVDGTHVVSVPAPMNRVEVGGLDPGRTYQVRVTAEGARWGDESAPSNTVPASTFALPHGVPIEYVTATVSAANAVYSADFLRPYAFQHVYVLRDRTAGDTSPCWPINYTATDYACAVYMIENDKFFSYTGAKTGDWSWKFVANAVPDINRYTYRWTVPLDQSTPAKVRRDKIVVQGQGYGPFTNVFPAVIP
ncbi:NPP1 family protein [Streptosporangium subroseum]|uniref:NPP1 family protein n=1 Tax=Streptosporangium subroseum TaxID=106412 RepID=UPI00341BDE0C